MEMKESELENMSYKELNESKSENFELYRTHILAIETYEDIVSHKYNKIIKGKEDQKNEFYEKALILAVSDLVSEKVFKYSEEHYREDRVSLSYNEALSRLCENSINELNDKIKAHVCKIVEERLKND